MQLSLGIQLDLWVSFLLDFKSISNNLSLRNKDAVWMLLFWISDLFVVFLGETSVHCHNNIWAIYCVK